MSDYAQDARDADASMREDGQLITLTSKTKGVAVGGSVPIITTISKAWGIDVAISLSAVGVTTVAGTLIKAGDRKLITSTLDEAGALLPAPKVGDTALVGAQLYTVKYVNPLAPGGVAVLYNLIVGI